MRAPAGIFMLLGVRVQRRKTKDRKVTALKEDDAYPALPEDGMVGRNCLASARAGTFARILGCKRA